MDPTTAVDAGKSLISNGVLGIAVVGLVYFVMILRAELRDVRLAHRVEIAEKDKLINELQEARVTDSRAGYDLARSVQTTQEAFLIAIRGKMS